MQKDIATIARANRLTALATLAERKARAHAASNVHQFPVARAQLRQPALVFTSSRGKRAAALMAA